MAVVEYVGLKTVPSSWPVNLPPFPNPGSGILAYASDDRVFIHRRDYTLKAPESYSGSASADASAYIRVYDLLPDNKFNTGGEWIGREEYVSKRREWLFRQELIGYPYMSDGLLHRKLPEPLRWGATLHATGVKPPDYSHGSLPVWMYADVRHAYKTYGTTHGTTTIDGIGDLSGVTAGYFIQGSGIPDGTTITSVNSATSITISTTTVNSQNNITLWMYLAPVMRYTHWATKIIKIDGIGESGQNPHSGMAFAEYGTDTGTTTVGSAVVSGLTHADAFAIGAIVTGTGIPANTYVVSIQGSNRLTLSELATASGTVTLTFNGDVVWPADEVFKRLRFTVLFERVNFEHLLRTEYACGGEWSRNTLYQDEPRADIITIFGGAKWNTNAAAFGQPAGGNLVKGDTFSPFKGAPKMVGKNTITFKWFDVPLQAYNWARIQSFFGSVNSGPWPAFYNTAPFVAFGKETLLFQTAGRFQKTSEAGVPVWDVTFHFIHFPTPDGFGGWNRLLNPRGYYQRYFLNIDGSKDYVEANDFNQLFVP